MSGDLEQALTFRQGFTIANWQMSQFRRDPKRLEADVAALLAPGLPPDYRRPDR